MSENGAGPEPTRYFSVEGVRYDWPNEMTGREMLYLEQETGLRSGEIDEAAEAGSASVLLAMLVIAMRRSGKPDAQMDDLLDLPLASPDGIDFLEDDGRPTADGATDGAEDPDTPAAKTGRRRSATPSGSSPGK